MGVDFSYLYAADLYAQLPNDARAVSALTDLPAWSKTEWLLASIEYAIAQQTFVNSTDAKHREKAPKPLFYNDIKSKKNQTENNLFAGAAVMTVDQFEAELKRRNTAKGD